MSCGFSPLQPAIGIWLPLPPSCRARDLDVKAFPTRLTVHHRPSGTTLLSGSLGSRCDADELEWMAPQERTPFAGNYMDKSLRSGCF